MFEAFRGLLTEGIMHPLRFAIFLINQELFAFSHKPRFFIAKRSLKQDNYFTRWRLRRRRRWCRPPGSLKGFQVGPALNHTPKSAESEIHARESEKRAQDVHARSRLFHLPRQIEDYSILGWAWEYLKHKAHNFQLAHSMYEWISTVSSWLLRFSMDPRRLNASRALQRIRMNNNAEKCDYNIKN